MFHYAHWLAILQTKSEQLKVYHLYYYCLLILIFIISIIIIINNIAIIIVSFYI